MDVCALCRPFDNQQQKQIRQEAEAVALILAYVEQNTFNLAVSPVHQVEIAAISDVEERHQLLLLLSQLGTSVQVNPSITRQRANWFVSHGMGVADAAHVAFAEEAQAVFLTVDDKLLRKCNQIQPNIWYGTPPDFCNKESL